MSEELRREIEADRDMVPIRVHALHDGTYIVKDGRHRLTAHIEAGFSCIAAHVENLNLVKSNECYGLLASPWAGYFICSAQEENSALSMHGD